MRRRPFHKGFSQQAAEKRTVHLHHVWKVQIEHVADRLFHQRVVSTDVEDAVAAQKIQIRLVIHVVEICAFGARIDFVETDDALRGHQRAVYMPVVQFVIFAKTRGDNLLKIESHKKRNFSDSRWKRKSCSHAPVARYLASHATSTGSCLQKKSCRIQSESCSSILRIQLRLFFDYHTFDRAMLRRPGVINTNPLAGSQWRGYDFAGRVNNVRSRAECETYRALLAPDDNRLAGLICTYRARLVSCARSRGGRRSCRRSFFGRGRAGLCKRQWRNQSADQSNDCFLHSYASFLIRFTSTVRDSRLERTLLARFISSPVGTT